MQEVLEHLGYLRSESLVYAALLETGPASAGIIAKKTGLNRISVYKALDKLIRDGLVSYVLHARRRVFKAANPTKIKQMIKERKTQLEGFDTKIHELSNIYKTKKENVQAEMYEGIAGLKTLLEDFLGNAKHGSEWLVLGGPKKAEILGGFFEDLNQRRVGKKVRLRIIYNKDAVSLIKARKKQPLTEIRIMPENLITPTSVEIINDRIAIVVYSPAIIAFSIENKEVADSFRHYFNLVWSASNH